MTLDMTLGMTRGMTFLDSTLDGGDGPAIVRISGTKRAARGATTGIHPLERR
jgi:hypothetical protein